MFLLYNEKNNNAKPQRVLFLIVRFLLRIRTVFDVKKILEKVSRKRLTIKKTLDIITSSRKRLTKSKKLEAQK